MGIFSQLGTQILGQLGAQVLGQLEQLGAQLVPGNHPRINPDFLFGSLTPETGGSSATSTGALGYMKIL